MTLTPAMQALKEARGHYGTSGAVADILDAIDAVITEAEAQGERTDGLIVRNPAPHAAQPHTPNGAYCELQVSTPVAQSPPPLLTREEIARVIKLAVTRWIAEAERILGDDSPAHYIVRPTDKVTNQLADALLSLIREKGGA